jgi:cytochrome b561
LVTHKRPPQLGGLFIFDGSASRIWVRAIMKWLLHQRNMVVREPTARHREFSIRSMLFSAVFIIMPVSAVIVDLAALLQFSGFVSGLPQNVLEIGGILTALTIFPLLAMGMSISMDQNRSKDT